MKSGDKVKVDKFFRKILFRLGRGDKSIISQKRCEMKIFLSLIVLSSLLLSKTYKCEGYGSSEAEAKSSAKQSALASSSTYIKSVFESKASTDGGKDSSYHIQNIANGVCKIRMGRAYPKGDEFYFSGICEVENEAITKTEEILKRLETLERATVNSTISTEKRVFHRGEKALINFSHSLEKDNYLYIVAINNRDETNLIYPAPTDQNLTQPNSQRSLPEIEVVPPFGRDILKIIASPLPLQVPKVVYGEKSKIFSNSRGFSNPKIANIEKELANRSEISDKDIIAHFRGQALNGGFTIYENHIELETRE
jgi:hypothetical protein